MYMRTGRRFVRRSLGASRKSSQWFWVDSQITNGLTTSGTPHATSLDAGLNTLYGARKTGSVIHRIVGDFSVRNGAPIAGNQGIGLFGLVMASNSATAAALDPNVTTGKELRWLWQCNTFNWFQAANTDLSRGIPLQDHHVDIKVKRRYPDEQTSLFFVDSQTAAAGGFDYMFHFRILYRVP